AEFFSRLRMLVLLHQGGAVIVGADHVLEARPRRRARFVRRGRQEGHRPEQQAGAQEPPHPALLRTFPAACGRNSLPATRRRPLTRTSSIPAAERRGSVKVDRSAIARGSKTSRSAFRPASTRPLSVRPSLSAGSEVILRTASSRPRSRRSRT